MSRVDSESPLERARRAESGLEFNRALDLLRRSRDLSFQAVSNNAGKRNLPKSTAHMMCTRDTLPTRSAQVEAFVLACRETPEESRVWLDQWRRINDNEQRIRSEHRIVEGGRRTTGRPANDIALVEVDLPVCVEPADAPSLAALRKRPARMSRFARVVLLCVVVAGAVVADTPVTQVGTVAVRPDVLFGTSCVVGHGTGHPTATRPVAR